MKKETKTTTAKNETNNTNNIKEVMEMAEVKVEVKNEKVRKPQRSFKEIILSRIDMKAKNLPDYYYDPIRESIADALNELELVFVAYNNEQKTQKNVHRKLSKFSKEEIESYLKSICE